MTNTTGYVPVFWKDRPEKFPVFKVINETVKIRESHRNRTQFFIHTGTLKITGVKTDDAGQYTLDVYTPVGLLMQMYSFTLNVKGKLKKSILVFKYIQVAFSFLFFFLFFFCTVLLHLMQPPQKNLYPLRYQPMQWWLLLSLLFWLSFWFGRGSSAERQAIFKHLVMSNGGGH